MVWRMDDASEQGFGAQGQQAGSPIVVKLMLVAVTFLLVTIGLILLQPRSTPAPVSIADIPAPRLAVPDTPAPVEQVAAAPVSVPEPTPAPEPVLATAPAPIVEDSDDLEVTRAAASLLELQEEFASQEASDLLRRPVAGSGTEDLHADIPRLAQDVLASYGYPVAEGDRLHKLLVQALSNRKSDAYIDALLNTAAARGEFVPPEALQLPSGRLDTPLLLITMVERANN